MQWKASRNSAAIVQITAVLKSQRMERKKASIWAQRQRQKCGRRSDMFVLVGKEKWIRAGEKKSKGCCITWATSNAQGTAQAVRRRVLAYTCRKSTSAKRNEVQYSANLPCPYALGLSFFSGDIFVAQ